MPADLPPPPGLEPLPGLRLREGVGVLPRVGRRWLLLALVAAIALVAAFMFGGPQLDFGGSDDEPDGAAITGTASPTAEATGTPAAGSMPDLSGLERSEAEQQLDDLGVTYVVIRDRERRGAARRGLRAYTRGRRGRCGPIKASR